MKLSVSALSRLLLSGALVTGPTWAQDAGVLPGASVPSAQSPATLSGTNPLEVTRPAIAPAVPQTGPMTPERVADYVLGPEDQIIIRAFEAEEISEKPVQVGADGTIDLPMIGRVKAGGLTLAQLEEELRTDLAKYISHPQVTVLVSDYRSQPVSVVGAVNAAGVLQLKGRKTLVQVVSLAGGLRADAGNSVTITRQLSQGRIPLANAIDDPSGRFSIAKVNLSNVMNAQTPQDNILIEPNDVLSVPRAQMVYVIGEVNKPGGYVLNDRDSVSLLQAISLAGGLTKTASPKKAKILREEPGKQDRAEVPSNVAKILEGGAPDITLHADDILFVPNNVSKQASIRALETAVNIGTGLAIWRF
jgi:polysaccharide biosynthesis/export protein